MTIIGCMISEKWSVTDKIFCHFGPFLAFYPPYNPENQNFENTKIMPGDIIILHICTINDNHIMYGSWNIKHDRQDFLSFWTVFCPFTSLTTWKIKILQKMKETDIIILHMCTINVGLLLPPSMQSSPYDVCNRTCIHEHTCHLFDERKNKNIKCNSWSFFFNLFFFTVIHSM